MRTIYLVLLLVALGLEASGDEPSVSSPDGRYILRLFHKANSIFPVIFLKDTRTGGETEVFDYESVDEGTTDLDAIWSPDSRHVAIDVRNGPATHMCVAYLVKNGQAREIEFLPIRKSLDATRHNFRGGTFGDHWEDNQTLWVGDTQKFRTFRYRLTKKGKLLTIGFKANDPY